MELAVLIVLAYFGFLLFLLIKVAMSQSIKGMKKIAVLIMMILVFYVATRGIWLYIDAEINRAFLIHGKGERER